MLKTGHSSLSVNVKKQQKTHSRGTHCDKSCILVVIVMIAGARQNWNIFLFAMKNTSALAAPTALVSSVTRLPQQDVFHAIVDVACWKHNETSVNPNYTSPGTRAALWDPVWGDVGSGETSQLWPLHSQFRISSWESKDKGLLSRYILTFRLLPCYKDSCWCLLPFISLHFFSLLEARYVEVKLVEIKQKFGMVLPVEKKMAGMNND